MVFWKKILLLPSFLVKKGKKKTSVFEDKCFLSKMFSQIKMQAATNWPSHLKKHQTFIFFSNDRVNAIFKNYIFRDF